ncbi:Methylosome subunit pICln [Aphelenchoides bicaudatus]|nr:Methylosome subunit pICln [Aphelenchoides bicaudatus]
MSAIVLIPTPEPTENVCLEQAQVKIVWEGHSFGFGTLYITERSVVWISDRSEDGFTLSYQSIGVYGVSSADHQHPEPSLFMVVDLNKTSIPLAPQPATNDSDEDDGLAEDGSRTATLRLIPDDANSHHSEHLEAEDSWFTEETPDDEIQLTEEGRANFEQPQNQDQNNHHQQNNNHGNHQNHDNGDQMDM